MLYFKDKRQRTSWAPSPVIDKLCTTREYLNYGCLNVQFFERVSSNFPLIFMAQYILMFKVAFSLLLYKHHWGFPIQSVILALCHCICCLTLSQSASSSFVQAHQSEHGSCVEFYNQQLIITAAISNRHSVSVGPEKLQIKGHLYHSCSNLCKLHESMRAMLCLPEILMACWVVFIFSSSLHYIIEKLADQLQLKLLSMKGMVDMKHVRSESDQVLEIAQENVTFEFSCLNTKISL